MQRRSVLAGLAAAVAGALLPLGRGMALGARVTGYLRTNWSHDPFSLGSYSYTPRGVLRAAHRALAAPVAGRLFFAGDATHPDHTSTVHAAYETGGLAFEAIEEEEHEDIAVIGAGMAGLPPGQFNQWLNLTEVLGEPIPLTFNGADAARDLAAHDDDALIGAAMSVLARAYGP